MSPALILTTAALCLGAAAEPAAPTPQRARRSWEVADSVGVVAHFWPRTPYLDRAAEFEKLLLDSGIRHVRTAVPDGAAAIASIQRLQAQGVGFSLGFYYRGPQTTVSGYVQRLREHFAARLDYLEAHNEPDGSWPDKANWGAGARAWMAEIRAAQQADPILRKVPFIGSPLAHPLRPATQEALGDCSALVDLADLHAYPGGRPPELSLPRYLAAASVTYPNRTPVITETGYHSALDNPRPGHEPASERAKAIYLPRLVLEHFRLGVQRSYFYQFLDDLTEEQCRQRGVPVAEAHFGLLDGELRPKPPYHAITRLLTLLADPAGQDFEPGELAYAVTGAPAEELRHLLLQKREGDFYLALWRTASVWDTKERVDLEPAAVPLTLTLARPARLRWYLPDTAAEPQGERLNTSTLELPADGRLLIIQIGG